MEKHLVKMHLENLRSMYEAIQSLEGDDPATLGAKSGANSMELYLRLFEKDFKESEQYEPKTKINI
jgi:hypothetical protein